VKVNCQQYEQFRGFIENAISDFVFITEEGLKASTGVLKKVMWKVKMECHQLDLYLCYKKKIVKMLFQEATEA
jgi:hypothetical protein